MEIVEVEWEDSALAPDGWTSALVKPKHNIQSVGYVQQNDEKGVMLVYSFDREEDSVAPYMCPLFIPRSAVRKVTKLGPQRRR